MESKSIASGAGVGSKLRKWAGWPACLALCAFCSVQADAKEPASDPVVAQGERLARMQCAACHIVANNQELPPLRQAPTPSFQDIANRPDATQKALQRFIASTHWDNKTIPMTMPDQLLTRDETRAVVRYILSLRKR